MHTKSYLWTIRYNQDSISSVYLVYKSFLESTIIRYLPLDKRLLSVKYLSYTDKKRLISHGAALVCRPFYGRYKWDAFIIRINWFIRFSSRGFEFHAGVIETLMRGMKIHKSRDSYNRHMTADNEYTSIEAWHYGREPWIIRSQQLNAGIISVRH